MMIPFRILCFLLVACLPVWANAQQNKLELDPKPRVLILGDSIYNQPSRSIASELKEQAQVIYRTAEQSEVFNSSSMLKNLNTLLGEEHWDLILFNCGLGDLVYRAPNMKSFRIMPYPAGGVRATDPEQYQQNLLQLVKQLKESQAQVIWINTTPIRHSTSKVFMMESEIEYNAIAAKVMAKHGISTCDMYSYVKALINMDKPAGHGADPFNFDKKPIHAPVVESIRKALELPAPPKEPEPDGSA